MNDNERQQFSRRLAEAMRAAGYEPRPSVLFKLFNSRYAGRSVTFQTVSRWLNGRSIPEQDKLRVLADALHVELHRLRFGTSGRMQKREGTGVNETRQRWNAIDPADRTTMETYLALPEPLRKHLRALIAALA